MLCFCFVSFSQSIEKFSLDSGGASVKTNDVEILFTLGEVFVSELIVDSNAHVSEGFINGDKDGSLSLVDNQFDNGFKIYPNPTSNVVFLKGETEQISHIELISVLGQKITDLRYDFEKVSLESLDNGVYFLKIYRNNFYQTFRVVKN
jgi:hypothetical protein